MSAPGRRRVTVINDSAEFVDVVREALEDRDCVVTGFTAEAVRFEQVVDSHPELIIVDLILDRRERESGWELMLLARSHPGLERVPIVLCSADVVALRERQADVADIAGVHVLEKPFALDELDQIVDRLLRR